MDIEVKSILLPPSLSDGLRVFVERRWPRTVQPAKAQVHLFLPEVAVSAELAKWTASHPQHSVALRKRYFEALREPAAEAALERLYAAATRRKKVTLLHNGKSAENSAAAILRRRGGSARRARVGSA